MTDDELRTTYEATSTIELVDDLFRLTEMHTDSSGVTHNAVADRLGHAAGVALVVLTNRHPQIADELDGIWQHADAIDEPYPMFRDALAQAVEASGVLAVDVPDVADVDEPYCDDGRTCGCPNPRED